MLHDAIWPFAGCIAAVLWLGARHVFATLQHEQQAAIVERGVACEGKVVAVQQPFLLDTSTRVYFDYVPTGSARAIRACHVARRCGETIGLALPAAGAVVRIRYLPERPRQAVIAPLV